MLYGNKKRLTAEYMASYQTTFNAQENLPKLPSELISIEMTSSVENNLWKFAQTAACRQ